MIRSFACAETERLFNDEPSRRLPHQIQRVARRKLLLLHQARRLSAVPPLPLTSDLRPLTSDFEGQKKDETGETPDGEAAAA